MGLNVGTAGNVDSYQKFSVSRFAYKHLFLVQTNIEGADIPSMFVLRGVFPFEFIQVAPIERNNSNIYYPELTDVNSVELEFYETMDNQIWNFFEKWYALIYKKDRHGDVLYNLPSNFKRDLLMFRLDTIQKEGRSDYTKVFGYKYTGVFPIRIGDYPADMSDVGVVTLPITFSVDNVERIQSPDVEEAVMTDSAIDKLVGEITWGEFLVRRADDEIAGKAKFIKALLKAAAHTGITMTANQAARILHYSTGRQAILPKILGF